jgi:hypothetical protein
VEVPEFEFIEAERTDPIGWISFYTMFDGVVGLAPFNVSWLEVGTPSLLKALLKQQVLKRNLFALRLPKGMQQEGELVLGKVPDEAGEMVGSFVLSKSSYRRGVWSVDVNGLEFDGNGLPTPENATIAILLRDQRIGLPLELAESINKRITVDEDRLIVDCATRSELPELRFSLGGGAKLVLGGFDYTTELEGRNGSTTCLTNIHNAVDPVDTKIQLGFGGLRRFITVFDLDNAKVKRMYNNILLS